MGDLLKRGEPVCVRARWLCRSSALALACAVGLSTGEGFAQDAAPAAADDGMFLETITITSRRYEESAQDAPVSVNVMTSDFLTNQRIDSVDDVIEFSPGTAFVRFVKTAPEYSMRGISNLAEGSSGESSVQTVIDDVVISKDFMKNPAMFDVQRVEVLRGPQGTAFGRNASAGLVHIVTKRPTKDFEAGITAGAGSHGLIETNGYISGPVTETLSARLAYNFDHTGGYTKSISTGKGLDGQENISIRGSLLFEPTDSLSIYFKAEYSEDNDESPVRRSRDCSFPTIDGTGATAPSPPHPPWPGVFQDSCNPWRTEISDGNFFLDREIINLTGEIAWDLTEGLTLTSVTGYLDGSSDKLQDAHGTPFNVLFQQVNEDAQSFSQELRLDNHASGARFRWLAGVYYLTDEHDRFDENQFFQDNALPFPRVPTKDTKISRNETESIGVFGEATYDITDKLNATFGVRWSRDEKDYSISHTGFGFAAILEQFDGCAFIPPQGRFTCGSEAAPIGFATPVSASDSWSDAAMKASLQYQIDDSNMVYALFSQGYKSGGFQPEPPNEIAAQTSFNKENSTNYEIGWKGEFNRQLRVSVSGYFLKYSNLQLSQFIQSGAAFFQAISNAGDAETLGVEAEATWQVTPNFRLSGSFSVLDAQLKNTVLNTEFGAAPVDFSGTRPDNVPKWTATAIAEYDFDLSDGSVFTLRADYRGRGNAFDDIGEQPQRLRPGIGIFGAQGRWTSADGHYTIAVWGRNIFREKNNILNIGPPQPNTIQLPSAFGPPPTYGGTISYRF